MSNTQISVCPDCDSPKIKRRSPSKPNSRGAKTLWSCSDCGGRFDDPREREPRSSTASNPGTVAALLEAADPSEVSSDD